MQKIYYVSPEWRVPGEMFWPVADSVAGIVSPFVALVSGKTCGDIALWGFDGRGA